MIRYTHQTPSRLIFLKRNSESRIQLHFVSCLLSCTLYLLLSLASMMKLNSLGPVDKSTVRQVVKKITPEEKARLARFDSKPPLDECLSLHDFEASPITTELLWEVVASCFTHSLRLLLATSCPQRAGHTTAAPQMMRSHTGRTISHITEYGLGRES